MTFGNLILFSTPVVDETVIQSEEDAISTEESQSKDVE